MALWKWEGGRQGGGYRKMKLAQIFNRADCYLIQYPEGFELPEHRDETPHGRHFRLNIFLKGEGDFYAEDVIAQGRNWALFRPDIATHGVRDITSKRTVLSFGCVL
mgnify:CR=1 FL=1